MIITDENSLICDLAETYNIYDYRKLPPFLVATLSVGLRANSRIMMKLTGMQVPLETILIGSIVDLLNGYLWAQTRDAKYNRNKPKSILDGLMGKNNKEEGFIVFNTIEEFENERLKVLERIQKGG